MDIKTFFDSVLDDAMIPDFLMFDKKKGFDKSKISFGRSKYAFYPGSGFDMTPIDFCNPSNKFFFYVFCDYIIPEEDIVERINYPGYEIIESFDLDLDKNILDLYDKYLSTLDATFSIIKPYRRIFIFEKKDKNIVGAERFMLVYYGMEATFVYKYLDVLHDGDLFMALIKDHGFGCNFSTFGDNGLLHKLVVEDNYYPDYIVCQKLQNLGGGPWREYTECIETEYYDMPYHELLNLLYLDSEKCPKLTYDEKRKAYQNRLLRNPNGISYEKALKTYKIILKYDNVLKLIKKPMDDLRKEYSMESLYKMLIEFIEDDSINLPIRYEIPDINLDSQEKRLDIMLQYHFITTAEYSVRSLIVDIAHRICNENADYSI